MDNQPADRANPVNSDERLFASMQASGGLRNATHRMDLSQPPFSFVPIDGRSRIVRRPSETGGRSERVYEFVRIFRLPLTE